MAQEPPQNDPAQSPGQSPLLDYHSGATLPSRGSGVATVAIFIGGLLLGCAASVFVEFFGAAVFQGIPGLCIAITVILVAKIFFWRRLRASSLRPLGDGIIASVGLMILFWGACFGILGLLSKG